MDSLGGHLSSSWNYVYDLVNVHCLHSLHCFCISLLRENFYVNNPLLTEAARDYL